METRVVLELLQQAFKPHVFSAISARLPIVRHWIWPITVGSSGWLAIGV